MQVDLTSAEIDSLLDDAFDFDAFSSAARKLRAARGETESARVRTLYHEKLRGVKKRYDDALDKLGRQCFEEEKEVERWRDEQGYGYVDGQWTKLF